MAIMQNVFVMEIVALLAAKPYTSTEQCFQVPPALYILFTGINKSPTIWAAFYNTIYCTFTSALKKLTVLGPHFAWIHTHTRVSLNRRPACLWSVGKN